MRRFKIFYLLIPVFLFTVSVYAKEVKEHPLIRPFPGSVLVHNFKHLYHDFGEYSFRVKDAQTGDVLPGVNVMITKVWVNNQETAYSGMLGAATDIQGEFIMLKVPPGIYSVSAQMMGYTTATH